MVGFLSSRKIKKEKSLNQRLEGLIFRKFKEIGLEDRMGEMNSKLDDVSKKMDEFMFLYESNCRQKNSPTARKIKVKDMIKLLLSQHGSLSAPQVSKLLNLSRTRCSEYLKEMEISGALVSELNCRKRYYKIRQ
jgi:response regulator of citrate/malate metabolism